MLTDFGSVRFFVYLGLGSFFAFATWFGCSGTPSPNVPDQVESGGEDSELRRVLASLPLSFGQEGIWFSNFRQALDVAGVSGPESADQLSSWPEGERRQYRDALGGIFGSYLVTVMRQTPEWFDAFGFSEVQVDVSVSTGPAGRWPFGTSFHVGRFDPEVVRDRLGALGYQVDSADGLDFHAIGDEALMSRASPVGRALYMSRAERIFVADDVLVASPDTEPLVQVLGAHNGDLPSLDESEPFSRVASALSDPLRAAILTREMVLEPEGTPPVDYDPPADWGSLHGWDLFGVGYGRTIATATYRFVLHYPEPDSAELDTAELARRVEDYLVELEEASGVDEFCQSWEPAVSVYGTGSVLTVMCETPVAGPSGGGVLEIVSARSLGFLSP